MTTELTHGKFPRLLIAGTHSGVGKTSVVIAILGALRRRGLPVQGFKVGPDFIDPMYHREVTGAPSYNLDGWLMGREGVRQAFARMAPRDEVSIIEGVMGLFDGRATGSEGSSAEVAALVQAPILLVLDVGGMSRSAAALVQGYAHFDPTVRVAGVVLNRVGGERHYQLVKTSIEEQAGVPVWGYLPWDDGLVLPERHLGLVPVGEDAAFQRVCRALAASAERTIDLAAIVAAAHGASSLEINQDVGMPVPANRARIGVARDAAFNFYYEANFRWLRHWGAELVEFSPLADPGLPVDVDGLYFGGGFPEVFAKGLAANGAFIEALRRAHQAGIPIYAECGGLMYLVEAIQDSAGVRHPMVGLLPGLCRLTDRLQNFGYKEVQSLRDSVLGPQGMRTRGHEFHYSLWEGRPQDTGLYWTHSSHGDEQEEGYSVANLTASYVHLHFDACPQVARSLVDKAVEFHRPRSGSFAPASPAEQWVSMPRFVAPESSGGRLDSPRPSGGEGWGEGESGAASRHPA
jgi:cobyrinic acid a,c-diamide synthase